MEHGLRVLSWFGRGLGRVAFGARPEGDGGGDATHSGVGNAASAPAPGAEAEGGGAARDTALDAVCAIADDVAIPGPLGALPGGVLGVVLAKLDGHALSALVCCSKGLRAVAAVRELWAELCERPGFHLLHVEGGSRAGAGALRDAWLKRAALYWRDPRSAQILVQTPSGYLSLVDPDGGAASVESERNDGVDEAEAGCSTPRPKGALPTDLCAHPVWCPFGRRIAYVHSTRERGPWRSRTEVVIAKVEPGGRLVRQCSTVVTRPPFYLAWAPCGDLLTWLSGDFSSQTIQLHVLSAHGICKGELPAARVVASGAPFYYDFSPTRAELVVHSNGARVSVEPYGDGSELDSAAPTAIPAADAEADSRGRVLFEVLMQTADGMVLQKGPNFFRAPQFLPCGRKVALVGIDTFDEPARIFTSITDLGGTVLHRWKVPREQVMRYGGVAFALSPDGSLVALTRSAGVEVFDVESGMSAEADADVQAPTAVADTWSGSHGWVLPAGDCVLAFFWSPRGARLLLLVQSSDTSNGNTYYWRVWDAAARRFAGEFPAPPEFQTSPYFNERVLPFHDQLSKSVSLWNPTEDAFCYAGHVKGVDPTGVDCIYVQRVLPVDRQQPPPARVAEGHACSWQPAPRAPA